MANEVLGERQAFSIIKKAYSKLNRKPITTASTLRLQVPLTSNKTQFTFPILQGDEQTVYNEAVLLNRADAFTCTSMGLFVGGLNADGTSNTTSSYPLYSYTSNAVNTAITASPNALFFNSQLNISINNVQYLQNFDTYRFYEAGVNQQNRLFGTGGSATSSDSVKGANNGFVNLVPTLQFSGTSKISITLTLPTALTVINSPILVLMFRGFLSLGASNLNK
jgi:hypothetical protein